MKEANAYLEAKRYVDNARKILSKHADKDGDYYNDPKYVKMACNTAYTGILVALDARFAINKKKQRPDADTYRHALGAVDRSKLKAFNSAYNMLHLLGGYDGDLLVSNSQTGLKLADELIDWTKPFSEKISDK